MTIQNRKQDTRTRMLLGEDGVSRLRQSSVAVFGVGGVGSHCVEALARSGVGKLTLIDSDRVAASNINRQSIAYHSTVGRFKTEVMRERIRDIDPDTEVETYETFVLPDNIESVFGPVMPDYIVDAIDTVSAKIALAVFAAQKGIPIISSMGTGNKLHPELFEIADLSETSVCPLCRVMRRELKKRGIEHLKVVYSKEKPRTVQNGENRECVVHSGSGNGTVADMQSRGGEEKGAAQRERRSTPGSVSFVPPAAGLMIAGEVIRTLAGTGE